MKRKNCQIEIYKIFNQVCKIIFSKQILKNIHIYDHMFDKMTLKLKNVSVVKLYYDKIFQLYFYCLLKLLTHFFLV